MKCAIFQKSAHAAAIILASTALAQSFHEYQDGWLDVIYVPTPHVVVKRMLELAKAGPDDIHYDLGSGDGRIAIASVRNFNVRKSVGIELDPERIRESLENLKTANVSDRVTFLEKNIFATDFSEATVITLYLLNHMNIKLRPIILAMRPGTRVVTQSFTMNEWASDYSERVAFEEDGHKGTRNVFLYIVPARVEGEWILTESERKISLSITQAFQRFGGTAQVADKRIEIKDGQLNGTGIGFTVEIDGKPVKYEGKVDGNTITGASWTAKKAS